MYCSLPLSLSKYCFLRIGNFITWDSNRWFNMRSVMASKPTIILAFQLASEGNFYWCEKSHQFPKCQCSTQWWFIQFRNIDHIFFLFNMVFFWTCPALFHFNFFLLNFFFLHVFIGRWAVVPTIYLHHTVLICSLSLVLLYHKCTLVLCVCVC